MLKWGRDKIARKKTKPVDLEEKYWLQLETSAQRSSRIRSLFVVHLTVMVSALGFSIVLTGVLPYLRRLTDLPEDKVLVLMGWAVAINPIGQLITSPIFGWLANKLGSIRMILVTTGVLYLLGNTLYACLSLLPHDPEEKVETRGVYRYSFMLLARLLIGISCANVAPLRSYIVTATWNHERNTHISIFSFFQALGFIIGPGIQSALTKFGCSKEYPAGQLQLDMYTLSGWVSVVFGLLSLVLLLPCIFVEHNISALEANRLRSNNNNNKKLDRPNAAAIFTCMLGFVVYQFNFVVLEVIGTPICMHQLGWPEKESIEKLGILLSIGAVASAGSYASIGPITKFIDERKVIILAGIVPMMIGRIVSFPIGSDLPMFKNTTVIPDVEDTNLGSCDGPTGAGGCDVEKLPWCKEIPAITVFQFYLSYAFISVSFPYCIAITVAILSKVIGPRPQGLWMGLITSAGSLARICGPIFISYVYVQFGTYWTFGILTFSLAVTLVTFLATYRYLVPADAQPKTNKKKMTTPLNTISSSIQLTSFKQTEEMSI